MRTPETARLPSCMPDRMTGPTVRSGSFSAAGKGLVRLPNWLMTMTWITMPNDRLATKPPKACSRGIGRNATR